jgi:hypothetical protein
MKLGQQVATSLPPRRQEIDVGKKNMDSLSAFVSNVIDILISSSAIDISYCSLGIDIMSTGSVIRGETVGYDDDSSIDDTVNAFAGLFVGK